jgi:hypothetical protein
MVMPSNYRGCRGLVVLVTLVLGLLGCGSSLTEVSGTVTVDGTPVEKGTISFYPADGKSHTTGGDITKGQYAVKVPAGAMRVQISVGKITGYKDLYESGKEAKKYPVTEEVLPDKFSDMLKTELMLDVSGGSMHKDWNLSTK